MTEKKIWSAKPFISHDGPDDSGFRAEVKISKGCGPVKSTETSDNGKAMKVTFDTGHKKFFLNGWVPLSDPVAALIQEVEGTGESVEFRIEVKRQAHVPRTTPIEEIASTMDAAKENVSKALVAVKRVEQEDADWVLSPLAITRMDEDPKNSTGSRSANDYTLEELQKLSKKEAAAPTSNYSGIEGPPFTTYNKDGLLNPGSVDVSVPLTVFGFLSKYFADRGMEVDRSAHLKVVNVVMSICNKAQVKIYEDRELKLEKPNLSLGSHTRARALVFENMEYLNPLTKEIIDDKELMKKWHDDTLTTIVKMWEWSIKEVEKIYE